MFHVMNIGCAGNCSCGLRVLDRRLDREVRLEVVETVEDEEAADLKDAGVEEPGVDAGLDPFWWSS